MAGPENRFRVRLQEILNLKRRLQELIARLEDAEFPGAPHAASHADGGTDEVDVTTLGGFPGGGTTFLRDDGTFAAASAVVNTDPAGALDGDGSGGSPLAVRVDGETVIINGDNELSAVPPPATNVPTNNTFLVSGGQVVWVSAYTFLVSAATYYINGTLYASPQTLIALSASDPTNDRFDILVLDTSGLVDAVEGTPSAQPAEPDVDPATQLRLALVLVAAASSQPGGATSVTVYAENAGGPGEWDWSTSGSGWNLASTNNPRNGSVDIEATTISSGAYIQGQIASGTFDPNDYDFLVLYIRSKATWANNRTLLIRLQNAGVVVGSTLTIAHGTYGFDSSNTTDYQQIAIPISFFSVPAGQVITQVRITRQGPSTIGFYLDDISFNGSGSSVPGGGLTLEQADARYAPLEPAFITTAAHATLPNERVLTGGVGITITDNGPGGTIVIDADAGSPGGSPDEDTVIVDAAGALDGDGSSADPLAVRVDGVTVIINGSNQLEAVGGGSPGGGGSPSGSGSGIYDALFGLDLLVLPPTSGWSWVNQGSATVASVTLGERLETNTRTTTDNAILRVRTAPSTPYTITACMAFKLLPLTNFNSAGICFRASGAGTLVVLGYGWVNGVFNIRSMRYNSPTSWASEVTTFRPLTFLNTLWLRIEDDGTDRKYYFSLDAVDWVQHGSEGRTNFLTADEVGFYCDTRGDSFAWEPVVELISWEAT